MWRQFSLKTPHGPCSLLFIIQGLSVISQSVKIWAILSLTVYSLKMHICLFSSPHRLNERKVQPLFSCFYLMEERVLFSVSPSWWLCVGTIRECALFTAREKLSFAVNCFCSNLKKISCYPPHSVFLALALSPPFRKIAFSQSTDCLLHLRANTGRLEH